MNKSITTSLIFAIAFASLLVSGCGGDNADANYGTNLGNPVFGEWVVVHELSDPEGINPIVVNDASASAIFSRVYEKLLEQDFETTELTPNLVEALPTLSDDHMTYTFTLKKGIKFSDGKPLTTKDVLFSFKTVKNPLIIDGAALRNYFVDIKDVVAVDDYTFTVNMIRPYFMAEYQFGLFWIMPKHVLDPKGYTDRYTFDETNDLDKALKSSAMKGLADWFNTAEVKREGRNNIGSGPYIMDEWRTGEAVILKKNQKWWQAGKDKWNTAYADKIVYKIVNDRNTAVVALKNQELDFMEYVPPPKFVEEVDTNSVKHLAKFAYEGQVYTYIGWNTQHQVLADKRVRLALSHLVDRDALIKQVLRGIGKKVDSPIYPQRPEYDKTIKPIDYNPETSRRLLTEAGWIDSDANGVVDRMIDGKKVELSFKFLLNAGNEAREQIALILVDEFKKVGIKAEIKKLEWTVFLDNLRTRNYDAYIGSWVNDPIPSDPYQLWHSSQADNKGSNYVGFRNKRADELMEMNRTEFDPVKRLEYMREFQQIVVDEQPYTFLWMPLYPAVYNKRLQNVGFSFVRPGYNPTQWWVSKANWRYAQVQ
ncbi:MAG: hypothetical protein HQ472_00160 [Ignavibacteria bacterium]|nr:hypothetical protein [Ignavibacteria bacterium]